jgi:cytochrome c-type biogenesis protein CcmH
MTKFIAIAARVVLAVLVVVLHPLWRSARIPAAALGAVLLLAVAGLYRMLGTPAALDAVAQQAPVTLQDAVAQLEAALQRDPNQPEGWRLLGRAYASDQQLVKARDAFARAATLAPDQPDVLVEAAEASALADPQRHFDAHAVAWLEQALQLQPDQQRARWFLGIAQRQAGQPAQAAKTWEPLLAQVDAKTAAPLRTQLNAARAEAGLPPLAGPQEAPGLQVKVSLDPELAARVRLHADASVFVIARIPGGPPMPVAAEKHSVSELPFTATLDDSDGPMPTQKLSGLQDVEVIARVSMSGNAMPQTDDLESLPVRVKLPATKPVELTIGAAHR